MLTALLWKEWHEQRWRLALACVWLMGATGIGLKIRLVPDGVVLGLIAMPMAILLPVFAGAGLFAEERHAKTFAYLKVQPVQTRQILLAKLILGWLVVALPFAATFALVLIFAGSRELPLGLMWFGFGVVLAFGVVMYLWQVLCGLRGRRPETYALVSAAVVGLWMIQGLLVDEFARGTALETWLWVINPFALVELLDAWTYRSIAEIWTVLLVQGVIVVGLAWAVWFRFERSMERTS